MDGSKIEVGVQELRSDLGRWLEEVKSGREVVITERGRPVARFERVDAKGSVSELVKAQRR